MRGSTIIMFLASLVFIFLGLIILLNKKVKGIIGGGMSKDNHKNYIKFLGGYYLVVGLVGLCLGILDLFLSKYSLFFVAAFVGTMLLSGVIQMKLTAKYIK